jgi:hypothetical protein
VSPRGRISREHTWIVLAALAAVVLLNIGSLGSDPWQFRPGPVRAHGSLAFLVRLAGGHWDLGLLRSIAVLAGCGVVVLAVATLFVRAWRSWVLVAAAFAVAAALIVPAVALQIGLRESTHPWFFVNDSTYQIELAGSLTRHGHSPYGHDYSTSGLERFYSLEGTVKPGTVKREVALHHFAYFPGAALAAAAWGVLPAPLDDYRVLVALATIALLAAALAFPGPLWARLALGTLAAANPIVVRAAWFGTADAPTLVLVLLAFALALRRRGGWSGVALGLAVLTKQFAIAAVPFLLATLLVRWGRREGLRAVAAAAVVLVVGFLPFLVADPGAVWSDTVRYGAGTYRIIGYGLSALLLRAHVLSDRNGAYPFFALAILVWLPLTALLVWNQVRSRAVWAGAVGYTISVFVLLFLGRVFQTSYLAYPFTGLVLTGLIVAAERDAVLGGLAGRTGRDAHQPESRPHHRILEEGVVEEAVHGDRHQHEADRERDA